jgi:hypothetical protein
MKKADNFDASKWLIENKITTQSRLNEAADTYPFQASPEKIALYNKIANELEGTISMIANKLDIPKSDIRISLDSLWNEEYKNKGMKVQVKADDTEWKEAWTGNALIMQTVNGEGVVISANDFLGTKIDGNKNPQVRAIHNKALELDLQSLVAAENAKITNSLTPEELSLIAPNTPVLVTGKGMNESKLNEAKVKNKYVVKDEELSDENGYDVYFIDKKKALDYLKQFNSKEVDAKQFIKDDEGWGEFEQYLEDPELMTDKELEDSMREELSFYYFSEPDGLD